MKKKLSLIAAAVLAAEVVVATTPVGAAPLRFNPSHEQASDVTPVNHRGGRRWRGRDHTGAIIGGLAAGAIIGGLLAAPRYRDPYYDYYDDYYFERRYYRPRVRYERSGLDAHQRWCLNRWRSYDIYSDTYQPYNGPRRYCVSPYS